MEYLHWLKLSFDGQRSIFIRASDDKRTLSHSKLLPILSVPLRDYSPIVEPGICLGPATIYKWKDEDNGL